MLLELYNCLCIFFSTEYFSANRIPIFCFCSKLIFPLVHANVPCHPPSFQNHAFMTLMSFIWILGVYSFLKCTPFNFQCGILEIKHDKWTNNNNNNNELILPWFQYDQQGCLYDWKQNLFHLDVRHSKKTHEQADES